ncbi:hypothetical protein H8959_019250 [Pygathrix nigripes]
MRLLSYPTLFTRSSLPGGLCGNKMAAPIPQGLSRLSRVLGWWSRQPVLVTQSSAIVPVRTKKRFTPPVSQRKFKTEKEFMEHARKAGLVIPPEKSDRSIHLACTAGIFDAYVPPEGDARISSLSKEGLIQRTERMKKTVASQMSMKNDELQTKRPWRIKEVPQPAVMTLQEHPEAWIWAIRGHISIYLHYHEGFNQSS